MAARDFSRAGETFVDYKGQVHEILYSIPTPLGYQALVSMESLKHIEKHPVAATYASDLPHVLNNPDLVTPNPDDAKNHIFYKSLPNRMLLATVVHVKNETRFVATMYETPRIKGLKQNQISNDDFLYLRGGFKWKRWK